MERKDWIVDIIFEYITKNKVATTVSRVNKLHDYFVSEGYDESVGTVLSALDADSKVTDILCKPL